MIEKANFPRAAVEVNLLILFQRMFPWFFLHNSKKNIYFRIDNHPLGVHSHACGPAGGYLCVISVARVFVYMTTLTMPPC